MRDLRHKALMISAELQNQSDYFEIAPLDGFSKWQSAMTEIESNDRSIRRSECFEHSAVSLTDSPIDSIPPYNRRRIYTDLRSNAK